jgi:hypothetical protein
VPPVAGRTGVHLLERANQVIQAKGLAKSFVVGDLSLLLHDLKQSLGICIRELRDVTGVAHYFAGGLGLGP